MLAFMGAQSFVMMFQAGEGWQYGKRRISAMSNEDFNKLTPERLLQNQAATLRSSLSTIEKSMNDMTPMIETIIRQYGDFLKEIIAVTPSVAADVTATVVKQAVKQTTGQDISLAVAEGIASGLAGPLLNLGQFLQQAEAQVPSGGSLTTDSSQFDEKVIETPKLDLPPAGINTRGFLGGPAPQTSIAQRFRQFEKTRSPDEKILAKQLVTLSQLKATAASLLIRIRKAVSFGGSRGNVGQLSSVGKSYQNYRKQISALERQIVLMRVKIARKKGFR